MSELLSPAGNLTALRRAITAGADAVYLGLPSFSARAGADNFTEDDLRTARRLCDAAGVKIYVTLNTLVFDRELPDIRNSIRLIAKIGVDGVIVQDLAVAELVRTLAPELPLHGSTQMTVHSLSGAKALEKLGFRRVVLARELSIGDIRHIAQNTRLETEVFVHGALCMCYSGHCYFSSVIGRNSGNRGRCAQPCRLPYDGDRYPLSLKDLCALPHLSELQAAGVTSFKIEGRLKSTEYVALVTRAYATALADKPVPPELRKALEDIFSRDGFTDGYLTGQTGKQMFGTKKPTAFTDYKQAVALADQMKPWKRFCLHVTLCAPLGAPSEWRFDDGVHTVTLTGPAAQSAETAPLNDETLFQKLDKLTDTPYTLGQCKVLTDGIFLPVSVINDMRRTALTRLEECRRTPAYAVTDTAVPMPEHRPFTAETQLLFRSPHAFDGKRDYADFQKVWLIPQMLSLYSGHNRGVIIDHFAGDDAIRRLIPALQADGISDVLVGNIGHIALFKDAGFTVWGDYALNITNSLSLAQYRRMGLKSATLSFEMSLPQMRDIRTALPVTAIVYGKLPLMVFKNCAVCNVTGCTHGGYTRLTDRKNETFLLECRADHGNTLYNGVPLFLPQDKLPDGISGRLEFTDESPETAREILQNYLTGTPPAKRTTHGLYFRGVR